MKTARLKLVQRIKDWIIKFYYRNKPISARDYIRLGILIIAIPIFLYSSFQLVSQLYSYIKDDSKYHDINNLVSRNTSENDPFVSIAPDDPNIISKYPHLVVKSTDSYLDEQGVLAEYVTLKERNSDMVAWIRYPGFDKKPIDYPVMYSGDNSFYLNRDFDKISSYAGSLFFDYRNKPVDSNKQEIDRNYIIYGHAMKNKSMFGNLTDYFSNKESWKNDTIYIDFMNTRLEYKVISTFLCKPDFDYRKTGFANDQDFLDYVNGLIKLSTHDFGQSVTKDDKILTLSTCYKSTRRTAIIAKLVKQIVYEVKKDTAIDKGDSQIKLPTYLPFKSPFPSKKVTPGVTVTATISGAATVSPSVPATPTSTPTNKPDEISVLTNFEDFENTVISGISSSSDIELFFSDTEKNSGNQSLKIVSNSSEPSLILFDVTDLIKTCGSGFYGVRGYIKSANTTTNVQADILLNINLLSAESAESIVESNQLILQTNSVSVTEEWIRFGNIEGYLSDSNGNSNINVNDNSIDKAYLIIRINSPGEYYLDTLEFFKKTEAVPTKSTDPSSSSISVESSVNSEMSENSQLTSEDITTNESNP